MVIVMHTYTQTGARMHAHKRSDIHARARLFLSLLSAAAHWLGAQITGSLCPSRSLVVTSAEERTTVRAPPRTHAQTFSYAPMLVYGRFTKHTFKESTYPVHGVCV